MGRSAQSHGFTLIELMIVVALLGIFATIAVPSFTSFINNNRLQSTSNEFQSLLLSARSDAVNRRAAVVVAANNGVWEAKLGTTVLRNFPTPTGGISITPSTATLTYRADGSSSAADYIICRDADVANAYKIIVQATGNTKKLPRGKTDASGTDLGACS